MAERTDADRRTTTPAVPTTVDGKVDGAAWLGDGLMLLTASLPVESISGAHLALGKRRLKLEMRSLMVDLGTRAARTGGHALHVVTLGFPMRPEGGGSRGRIVLSVGAKGAALSGFDVETGVTDLRTLLRERLAGLERRSRAAVMEFLLGAVAGSARSGRRGRAQVGHPRAGGGHDMTLSASLRTARDILREHLPLCELGPDRGDGLVAEAVLNVDDHYVYMDGWIWEGHAPISRLTAVSPEGCRVELRDRLHRRRRVDVEEFYRPAVGDRGGGYRHGFITSFPLDVPTRSVDGWILEMETSAGVAMETPFPPAIVDAGHIREKIVADLAYERLPDDALRRTHARPALRRLQDRSRARVAVDTVDELGRHPASPDVSVVVPLYGRIDFAEHQLAQFALDPAMRDVDLIYVLDSPELGARFRDSLRRLTRLYDVPVRAVVLTRNGGFATACNIGASMARGRLLLLLNSDVLPDVPGWLPAMARFYDTTPNVGALGCKLLYEDNSLQHAGMYFERPSGTSLWNNAHFYKGLHRDLDEANISRPVPAVTAACLMVDTGLYRDVGGLSGEYLQGDFEDSDLCLRLNAGGRDTWYTSEVELYHLEGQSYPSALRAQLTEYNCWLHTHLWNERIESLMERYTDVAVLNGHPAHRTAAAGRRLEA